MIPVAKPCLGKEELQAISEVFASNWLGLGAKTKEFEDALKNYLGCKYLVAVNTGTTALHLALDSLGLKTGDEVIVPSLTFAATIQAIVQTGATPVFCDIEETTLNIDVHHAKALINKKTKAIVIVHYCGQPCHMDELLSLGLPLVEDAAHAFGSSYKHKKIGSFGNATCFSFDPIKNITTIEGGAIATSDEKLYELMIHKRILGIDKDTWSRYENKRVWEYDVTTSGYRYHLPNVNAAVGLEQMKKLPQFLDSRTAAVKAYMEAFRSHKDLVLLEQDLKHTAFFCYIVKVKNARRNEFMAHLKEQGVASGIHYIPNHYHSYFRNFPKGDLAVTEKVGSEIVTLPLYNLISTQDVEQVIKAVNSF